MNYKAGYDALEIYKDGRWQPLRAPESFDTMPRPQASDTAAARPKVVSKRKVGMPVGTEVEVMDLFYNLPVRRKFLRREDTERNRIASLIKEYAIVNPRVAFIFFSNGREILNLKPSDERGRIEDIFGDRFELISSEREFLKVRAYVKRNVDQGSFYIFVNSRPISSKNLKEFLKKVLGYRTLGIIFLELPPFLVDFNVHPKKREVRFVKERRFLSILREALSKREEALSNFLSHETPRYETDFQIIGQLNNTLILAKGGDYLYFFDQHLLSERINYERLEGKKNAEEIACRASLKAGQPLTEKEMRELLKEWRNLENPHVCPHGRPIYYRIHLKEIYTRLGRGF